MKELIAIQSELKAPKNHKAEKYMYRSAEDILEAVKPFLKKHGCILTLTDDIEEVGSRVYVKATATLVNSDGQIIQTSAYAREEESSKFMSQAQLTGSSSSYARKYALNGLFCLDDAKDPDAINYKEVVKVSGKELMGQAQKTADLSLSELLIDFAQCNDRSALVKVWDKYKDTMFKDQALTELRKRKQELGIEK